MCDMLPPRLLDKDEKKIVDALRKKGPCGFNELCNAVSPYPSRPTVHKIMPRLVKMQLVQRRRARRRGQKDQYMLTEFWDKFEEKTGSLESMWNGLFDKLDRLENLVKEGKFGHQDAGFLIVKLIFEAVPLLPTTLEPSLPLELNERLLIFSADWFRSYWEEIMRLGHESADIGDGFQKGCEWLRGYVKPISEEIEEALGK